VLTPEAINSWKTLPPDLRDIRVSILGIARSGAAVAKLLHSSGCKVFISDTARNNNIGQYISELQSYNIEIELGGHSDKVLNCDLLIRSPGVPADVPILKKARKKNICIAAEIEVASWFCRAPIIAVTGSNGKTTTVEWIGDLFHRAGKKTAVCGNVGTSFSSVAADMKSDDIIVLEVSSFQLEDIHRFRPRVAVITNFSPDHLDRYDSYEDYIDTKCKIYMNHSSDDALIFNRMDDELVKRVMIASGRKISFGTDAAPESGSGVNQTTIRVNTKGAIHDILDVGQINLPGRHNFENALSVAAVAVEMGVSDQFIRESLGKFSGVPHRLEVVDENQGVLWVNDSKATNIASGLVALESYNRPIVLLVGGRDKGSDFRSVAEKVANRVKSVILFGEAGSTIERAWAGEVPLQRVSSMAEAIKVSTEEVKTGDVVLLSPMCASFDEFRNYEHRGESFKALVKEYVSQSK
jgi:UDP-N-acetylmuramoylalanine--D-glutamate ligase